MKLIKKISKLFSLIGNPTHSSELIFKLRNQFWPLLYWLAFFYRKYFLKKVKIIVVVGSVGKSSATHAIKTLLGIPTKDTFISNAFGAIASQILQLSPNTKFHVMEIGIGKKGDMESYARMVCPNIVVLTAIASDHATNLGHLEDIWKEKAKILKGPVPPEIIILNGDDKNVLNIGNTIDAKKVTFGFGNKNTVQCVKHKLEWPVGYGVSVSYEKSIQNFQVPVFGEKLLYSFLASISVALSLNIPLTTIRIRIKSIKPANGRMQVVKLPNGATLIKDEFKSTTESALAALEFMKQIPAKRKILVFGTMSHLVSNQRQHYKSIGAKIGESVDMAYLVLSKDAGQIVSATAKNAGMDASQIIKTKNNWVAIKNSLQNELKSGDVVMIKGKHEQRLERLSLFLMGKEINCHLKNCDLKYIYCKDCSFL